MEENDLTHVSFPLVVSIEDPFDQDDWPAWSQFTASVGIQVRYYKLCHYYVAVDQRSSSSTGNLVFLLLPLNKEQSKLMVQK